MVFCHPNPVPSQHSHRDRIGHSEKDWRAGPSFDRDLERNLTAIEGRDIQLPCKVFNLANRTVRKQ